MEISNSQGLPAPPPPCLPHCPSAHTPQTAPSYMQCSRSHWDIGEFVFPLCFTDGGVVGG